MKTASRVDLARLASSLSWVSIWGGSTLPAHSNNTLPRSSTKSQYVHSVHIVALYVYSSVYHCAIRHCKTFAIANGCFKLVAHTLILLHIGAVPMFQCSNVPMFHEVWFSKSLVHTVKLPPVQWTAGVCTSSIMVIVTQHQGGIYFYHRPHRRSISNDIQKCIISKKNKIAAMHCRHNS